MNATDVRALISNDLWQNSNPSNVGVEDFKSLDKAVEKLTEPEVRQEFRAGCEADLADSCKNSIAIRYLLTITGRHPFDDRYILSVLEQYYEASKTDEAIFLGEKILTFNESSYALKVIAECYAAKGMEDKKIQTWERLVRVDYDETEVLYNLAKHYADAGDTATALKYYRSVIRRHLKAQDLNALKSAWDKVVELNGDDSSYLIGLATKIADSMGSDKGVYFLNNIYERCNFDNEKKIDVLKKIIRLAPNDTVSRDKLVELWKDKYKDNPRLGFCLNNTGIVGNYMNINTCIENFEKQILFVEGAFVYHEQRRLGKIQKILKDEMQILFPSAGAIKMSSKMAYSSLKVLPKSHIWVLKAAVPKEKLVAKFTSDIQWGLKILLSSFGNKASLKDMKAELVPAILDEKAWKTWKDNAEKELKSNDYFGIYDVEKEIYEFRSTPMTYEEKAQVKFNGTRDLYEKFKVLKDFISDKGQTDSDEFLSMVGYLESTAKSAGDSSVAAYLMLKEISRKSGIHFPALDIPFEQYYGKIANVNGFFKTIKDSDIEKSFVDNVKENIENWQNILIELFPLYRNATMAKYISDGPKKNAITKILVNAADNFRNDPDFFLYLTKAFKASDWAKAKYTKESLMFKKLNLLAFVNLKIKAGSDVSEHKKYQKILLDVLFDNEKEGKEVYKYLENADAPQAQKLFSIIKGIEEFETTRLSVKHDIIKRFPNEWEAITGESPNKQLDIKKIIPKGLLCTQAMLEAKSADLEYIMNVEIPENSKEIGTARELGDLRENAEYQYGKDRQKELNARMNTLTDEIDSARVIKPEDVDTTLVSFGTKVTFLDNRNKKEIVYTIMGPWESDPSKNILNFKAPLGQKLYNLEVGENTKFNINGVDYDFTVKKIELAEF